MSVSTLPVSNQVISDLAYDVIVKVDSGEELIFEENRDVYFADPAKALAEEQKRDELLGAGTEFVILLTPFVLAIVSEVVKFLAEELKKALGTELGDTVKLLFKRYKPKEAKQRPPPLTIEQLARVRQLAYAKAIHFKLPIEQATQIADAVAGSLVMEAA